MAFCVLTFTSCESLGSEEVVLEVSIKNPAVGAAKGQQFVNVKCSGSWSLVLVADDEEVTWARLDVTQGIGDKSNVKLSYDANDTDSSRELKIILDGGSSWVGCSLKQSAATSDPGDGGGSHHQLVESAVAVPAARSMIPWARAWAAVKAC